MRRHLRTLLVVGNVTIPALFVGGMKITQHRYPTLTPLKLALLYMGSGNPEIAILEDPYYPKTPVAARSRLALTSMKMLVLE